MNIQHQNLSDHVLSLIRKMILNGTLKPGDRVNQVQLAEKLNISRGPIREALRMLQNEGLIKHEVNKGTFITTLSDQDAYEIYTLRAILESSAARLAIQHLTEKDFTRLDELLTQFKIAFEEGDLEKEANCDIEFHRIIVRATKHQRLIHMHQQLDTQVGAMFLTVANVLPQRASKVVDNHRRLLDSLHSKDINQIMQDFSDHYIDALKELRKMKSLV